MSAVFEWRSEYTVDLVEAPGGDLEVLTIVTTVNLVILSIIFSTKVMTSHPSASVGLYHHYNVKVVLKDENNNSKQILTGGVGETCFVPAGVHVRRPTACSRPNVRRS